MAIQEIKLNKNLSPLPPTRGDFGQLRQAFLNILVNACEAMPKGGVLGVASRARDGVIEVEISDNGQGMTPEQLAGVCDPFYTTKERGTGLGMSVVHGIIEQHEGKLHIRSEPGKGTTITITLRAGASPAGGE